MEKSYIFVPYIKTCGCPAMPKILCDVVEIVTANAEKHPTGICSKCHKPNTVKEIVHYKFSPEQVVRDYLVQLDVALKLAGTMADKQKEILNLFENSLHGILLKNLSAHEVDYWKNRFYIEGDFGYSVAQMGVNYGFIYFTQVCPRECTHDNESMALNSRPLFDVLRELNLVQDVDKNSHFSMDGFHYFKSNHLALIHQLSVNRYSEDGKLIRTNVDTIVLDKKLLLYVDVDTFNAIANSHNLPKLSPKD
jgi:hypothetical protein